MSEFTKFGAAVAARFALMCSFGELYRTTASADDLWDLYLASFPEGTNPIFRERTEHDGSYDRNFIKRLGNVVAIDPRNDQVVSLWNSLENLPYPYDVVAQKMADHVGRHEIKNLFRTKEMDAGHKPNFELINGRQHQWTHFYVRLPNFVITRDAGAAIGQRATNVALMSRSLTEINQSAIVDVLDLIEQNALYRGEEHKPALLAFQKAQNNFLMTLEGKHNTWLWKNSTNNVLMIKNTAIGTLLVDLSDGMPLEQAVKSFESKVAPANYKRTSALITPAMVTNAMAKIEELGYANSLYRRHAVLADINVNDIEWADASAKNVMAGSIGDVLMQAAVKKAPKSDTLEEINIREFMSTVLPKTTSMEMFVSNALTQNLINITAPEDADAPSMFKWDNAFGWSYKGNVADSIKERVKAAGGNVKADLRVSLAWHNSDDLDLHCVTPDREHINFSHKAGVLDVDMNGPYQKDDRNPVENMAFMRPQDGVYTFSVDQYSARSNNQTHPGFTLQVECGGELHELTYQPAMRSRAMACISLEMKGGVIKELKVLNDKLIHQGRSQKVNGVNTESFVRVSTMMFSPNYWGDQAIGNKHYIFLLEGAQTDEPVRGIYNEFLKSELEEHRKVFEVLGAKTVIQPQGEQLAGVGFSSTVRNSALIKVSGPTINKTYKVMF